MRLTVTMIEPTGPETAQRTTITMAATTLRRARGHARWALAAFPNATEIRIQDEEGRLVQTLARQAKP